MTTIRCWALLEGSLLGKAKGPSSGERKGDWKGKERGEGGWKPVQFWVRARKFKPDSYG